ncbi:endophilin-B2b isoform X6 [Heptranchias perlo]|uniref:endophilin-B2b isoform X6 n=1 Tax=Heptranchias perlo TaxID=212740 RepID=UPI00355A9B55
MDFNVKKLASDAGVFFTRAVQFTEEKLGQAEKTELDAHFENLLSRADSTKNWTEKILRQTEVLLQPNPSARIEEFLYEKLDRKIPSRITNGELLGQYMIDAASEFGPGTPYGSTLIKVGEAQRRLGAADRDFIQSSMINFLTPLRNFLEGDWKTISAEQELRLAQTEFDRQAEVTRLLLEGISSTHTNHLRCLHEFVEAQATYYAQCYQYTLDLQKLLGSSNGEMFPSAFVGNANTQAPTSSASPSAATIPVVPALAGPCNPSTSSVAFTEVSPPSSGTRKARVLYDYDAADSNELSLLADELITVYSLPGMDSDWLMGEKGNKKGKVPVTYLELLN